MALRPLAALLGAEFAWPASLALGLATGLLGLLWSGRREALA
ncbi:MAG: hypothetical protein ACUVRM_05400 [Bacillota bacterium]